MGEYATESQPKHTRPAASALLDKLTDPVVTYFHKVNN